MDFLKFTLNLYKPIPLDALKVLCYIINIILQDFAHCYLLFHFYLKKLYRGIRSTTITDIIILALNSVNGNHMKINQSSENVKDQK